MVATLPRAGALRTRGLHDVVGGSACRGVEMHGQDRQGSGLSQHHHGQGPGGPRGDDQEFHPRSTAGHGHHADVANLVSRDSGDTAQRVKVWHTIQRRPIDADIDDLTQGLAEGVDQFGQFSCFRRGVRPPCPVKVAAQLGCQSEPDRAIRSPFLQCAHGVAVHALVAENVWPAGRVRERMRSMDSSLSSRSIRRGLHAGIGIRIGSHDDLGRPRRGGITLTNETVHR